MPPPDCENSSRPEQSEPAMPSALRHAVGVELHEEPRHDRAAENAGQARRVKADLLARMARRVADAVHHFEARDESGQQLLAAAALGLRDRDAGRGERGARVHADARMAQAVELERVREHAVGERGHLPAHLVLRCRRSSPCPGRLVRCTYSIMMRLHGRSAPKVIAPIGVDDAGLGAVDRPRAGMSS